MEELERPCERVSCLTSGRPRSRQLQDADFPHSDFHLDSGRNTVTSFFCSSPYTGSFQGGGGQNLVECICIEFLLARSARLGFQMVLLVIDKSMFEACFLSFPSYSLTPLPLGLALSPSLLRRYPNELIRPTDR